MVLLEVPAHPDADPRSARRRVRPATAWVGLVTAAYVAVTLRWITGPVGLSHDGENLGVFAMGSRAMRDLGLVASKGGSVLGLGHGSYAHHPPLLVWLIYLSEAAFGVHPWTARLPTACASVAVIWLLYGLLRDLRVGSWPAAVGVTIAVGSPMFLLYGWMSDTPMLALPFALVIARWWVQAGRDDLPPPVSTTVVVASGLGALAGWEFSWWCAVLVVAAFLARDHSPRRWRLGRLIAGGVALGLVATAAWVSASSTGMGGLIDAFTTRAGLRDDNTLADSVRHNLAHATQLSVPLTLALLPLAVWIGLRDRRSRLFLLLAGIGVGGYAAIFWQASSLHDYWNEWSVVPVAVAFGAGAAEAIAFGRRRLWARPVVVVVAFAATCAIWAPLMTTGAEAQLSTGARLGREVSATRLAPDQTAWLVSGLPTPREWLSYVSGRPLLEIDTEAAVVREAVLHPQWVMVASCRDDLCAAMAGGGTRVENVVINRVGVIAGVLVTAPGTR